MEHSVYCEDFTINSGTVRRSVYCNKATIKAIFGVKTLKTLKIDVKSLDLKEKRNKKGKLIFVTLNTSSSFSKTSFKLGNKKARVLLNVAKEDLPATRSSSGNTACRKLRKSAFTDSRFTA